MNNHRSFIITALALLAVPCLLFVVLVSLLQHALGAHGGDPQELMLIQSPARLVYAVGQDKQLDIDGGRVRYCDEDNEYYEENLAASDVDLSQTDVDFTREGVYLVSVSARKWLFFTKRSFQYTVQVVSPGTEQAVAADASFDADRRQIDPARCANATAYMVSPPVNIIYPVGYTGEINLAGIAVKPVGSLFADTVLLRDTTCTCESDVDFSKPGSYIATVTFTDDKGEERWFCFTVAVLERTDGAQ